MTPGLRWPRPGSLLRRKTAQLEPHRMKEVRGRRRVLATAVGVFHQISGGKENIKKGSLLDLGGPGAGLWLGTRRAAPRRGHTGQQQSRCVR